MFNRIAQFNPSLYFDDARYEPLDTAWGSAAPNSKLETLNSKQILNLKLQNKNRLVSSIEYLASILDFPTPAFAENANIRQSNADIREYSKSFNSRQLAFDSRESALKTVNSTLSTVNSYAYTYDNVGNRLTMTDSIGTHNYGYDDLYRLTSATLPSENYTYDPVGNRNPASFVYDNANRLLDDGAYTYTYNIENQLIRVSGSSGNQVDYVYDGLGRRIEKDVNGAITRYVYDNEDIIAEYDGSNTLQAKYLHGPGIDEPLRMERGGQKYWYHADGLGSITAITNSSKRGRLLMLSN
jgi:YD repeat-containing protein